MYQSQKAQLLSASKESKNKNIISKDVDQMVRNRLLEQGIQPMLLDESDVPNKTNIIMEILKKITYQPKKVYSELFNKNELNDFLMTSEEFMRKYLKNRRNISASLFMLEWDKFKSNPTGRQYTIKELANLTSQIIKPESSKRHGILTTQGKERSKLNKDFNTIKKEIDDRQYKISKIKRDYVDAIRLADFEKSDRLEAEIMKLSKEKKDFEEMLKNVEPREQYERNILTTEQERESNRLEDIRERIDDLENEYQVLKQMDGRKKEAKDKKEELDTLRKELLEFELAGFGIKKRQKRLNNKSKSVNFLITKPSSARQSVIYPINHVFHWM